MGKRDAEAKCDFAIPSKDAPRILVEAKRHDTALLFLTDGLTWKQRQSDLKTLIERQNNGEVARIYTTSMSGQFEADLMTLKAENKL